MVQNSSTFAQYFNGGPVGILPQQSMFDSSNGLWDARSSFVRMLNNIFAATEIVYTRPDAVAAMVATTPIDPYLVWRRPTGTRYIEPIPPNTLWDIQVFSIDERNDPTIPVGTRILVNGIGNVDAPQWSVYIKNSDLSFSLMKSYDYHVSSMNDRNLLITSPVPIAVGQKVLVDGVASTYGFWTVWEYTGAVSASTDTNGFILVRYQTYNTSDFWSYVDWYATGYSSTTVPVVTYATPAARDTAELPNPKTTFVKVNDDGTGRWIWSTYDASTGWTVVAKEYGTIEFSSKFYDGVTRPTIGFDPISISDLANIPNRDGRWELRVLFDMLRDVPVLLDSEVNTLFFSILHFIHTQQEQVDWAFKTSFMSIGGYNEQLTNSPVQPNDNTTNLTNYINEIKPYRTKIRDFSQVLTPPLDNTNVHASDFDFPVYYDSALGKNRTIEPIANTVGQIHLELNATDLELIQNTAPYSDWYQNYTQPEYRPEDYNPTIWNPIRHFKITQIYDRIDHMPTVYEQSFVYSNSGQYANTTTFDLDDYSVSVSPLYNQTLLSEVYVGGKRLDDTQFTSSITDPKNSVVSIYVTPNYGDIIYIKIKQNIALNAAADRIREFYDPTGTDNAEKNIRHLMGLDFKQNILDGGSNLDNTNRDYDVDGNSAVTSSETLNPNESYYGLRDPAIDKDRPEELIVAHPTESLNIFYIDSNSVSNSYTLSQALPTSDLMAPLNVGDYDERPLDETHLDVGYTQKLSNANTRVITADGTQLANANVIVQRNVFVNRSNAWETKLYVAPWATLIVDTYNDANTIVVQPFSTIVDGKLPITSPIIEQVATTNNITNATTINTTITKPGAVWLNGERIEFFGYDITSNGTVVTLKELRRGSRSTRIGNEQRFTMNIGNVSSNVVTLPLTITDPNLFQHLEVYTYGTPTNVNGVPITSSVGYSVTDSNGVTTIADQYTGYSTLIPMIRGIDFTTNLNTSNNVVISFKTIPIANTYVSLTTGVYHPAGSVLRDAMIDYLGQTPAPDAITWVTENTITLHAP